MSKVHNASDRQDQSAGGRPAGGLDLAIALVRGAGPLHAQLEDALRTAVADGRLARGAPLPPSRSLAADLGVSRGVVVEAYAQLVAESVLTTVRGGSTRVSTHAGGDGGSPRAASDRPGPLHSLDLRTFVPELSAFPRRAWAAAAAAGLRNASDEQLSIGDPCGDPDVRAVLAAYTGRARGVRSTGADTVVTSGTMQSVALLAQVLRRRADAAGRAPVVIVEDPGFAPHHQILRRHGLQTLAVPVDDDGIVVERLPDADVVAVLVTPAHQFPLGGVLPQERRDALLAWATDHDAIVVEDDYDGEYRYDRDAPAALQAAAPERVVHLATVSKTLAAVVRLGWMAVPPTLLPAVAEAKAWADAGTSALVQFAMAELVTSGAYDRHVRRGRDRYRRRRDLLVHALRVEVPDATPLGVAAGLHVVLRLPANVGLPALLRRAWDDGVAVQGETVGQGSAPDGRPHPLAGPILLVGFGNLPDPSVAFAARTLGRLVTEARGEH